MPDSLVSRVNALEDKQAIYVAQSLSKAVYAKVQAPPLKTMAGSVDRALADQAGLSEAAFSGPQAGEVARAVLSAWAALPELAPAVEQGIARFKTAKQDLGVLSVPIALGLTYALLAMDLDVDLGFAKVKKKGLSGKQQAEIIRTTIAPVLKAIRAIASG